MALVVLIVAGGATSAETQALAEKQAERPNILFIMVDDMGHSDLSLTGSHHIETPNIDSLARDGLWLHQGYSSTPICSPTRAALLTGNYAQRYELGVEEPLSTDLQSAIGMPLNEPTIASLFRDLGYRTTLIGKWHLGAPPAHGPLQHGYDSFFGIVEGGADYIRHSMVRGGNEVGFGLSRDNEPVEATGYLTDLFGNEAAKVIETSGNQPFFISLHFTAPHWPWEGREDQEVADMIRSSQHYDGGSIEKYREMMEIMDENVGTVLAALEHSGKADNTVVIFTSDNGAERFSETWPFIGYKAEVLEGGIRVPILVRWRDRIAPGSTSQQVMASMDFLPTLLTMAGGNPGAAGNFDGIDLSQQILGRADPIERALFWRFKTSNQAAVRLGDWKYVSIGGNEHLYNLAHDVRERADRKMTEPERFEAMRDLWDAWNSEMRPYRVDGLSDDLEESAAFADRY